MAGFGLRLGRSQGMEGYTGNLNEFFIDPANTNPIFTGDPVILSGGNIEAEATGTAAILGVFFGCRYVDTDGSYEYRSFWDGNSGRSNCVAHVAMPSHHMFHVKLGAAVPDPSAVIGASAALVAAAGSTAYGDSRYTATPGVGPLVVHRLVNIPGNEWGNDEPIVEVSVRLQQGTSADAA